MKSKNKVLSPKQIVFKELFVGTLVYAVVLGFFNDYTSVVDAKSFSTIFYSAIVLEILTYLTFLLKDKIVAWLRVRRGLVYKILMFFFIWLVMFLSKFVFVWIIDMIFGNNINISGFLGVLLIVLCVTIVNMLANKIFIELGDK